MFTTSWRFWMSLAERFFWSQLDFLTYLGGQLAVGWSRMALAGTCGTTQLSSTCLSHSSCRLVLACFQSMAGGNSEQAQSRKRVIKKSFALFKSLLVSGRLTSYCLKLVTCSSLESEWEETLKLQDKHCGFIEAIRWSH